MTLTRTSRKSHKNRSNAVMETMERRQMMSASPYVINGTAGNDVINVVYGMQLVLAQASAPQATPSPTAAAPAGAVKAAAVQTAAAMTTGTTQSATTSTATASFIPIVPIGTIFNQLKVTVNGVTTTTTLNPGQTLQVNGLDGNDKITVVGSVNAEINGGNGNDTLISGNGKDSLNGGNGDDFLDGGLGADNISGGAGTDTVDYSSRSQNVTVVVDGYANDGQAGEGDNVSTDVEIVNGGWGNDLLVGNLNDNVNRTFFGNYGNDTVIGGGGNDQLNGGPGNDSLCGMSGNDTLHGGAGDDIDDGGSGNDVIYADSGNDTEYGGIGNDQLFGGTGVNLLHGGAGDDIMVSIGGSHIDRQYGEGGNDSFWLDAESTECVMDATASQLKTNVHRVAAYDDLHVNGVDKGAPARGMYVGNLPDPVTAVTENGKNYVYGYKSFAGNPLFSNGAPLVTDVNQGNVGDCYFMATLSAVAKTSPNVIRQSVVDLGDGTYAVDFKRGGPDHFIRVDADLPVTTSGNPAFAHWSSATHDMWVPIMEKAWAYFRNNQGCYSTINGGFPAEVFNTLGMHNDEYDPHSFLGLFDDSPQDFGHEVQSLLSQGNAVTLCTSDGVFLEKSHCYMVDHVSFIGNTVVSITLRNPWGTDGKGGDSNNDGYVTLDATETLASCDKIQFGHA